MRLTEAQREAVKRGSPRTWLGTRETGVMGSTMAALERKGLAVVRETKSPYRRCVYRLSQRGNELRVEWAIESATRPIEHVPIPVRCTHCGAEFPDGTIGGSCTCGQPVEAIHNEGRES